MMTVETREEILKDHLKGIVKQFLVYDGSDRVIQMYTAKSDAVTGDDCMLTTYTYVLTSTRIEKRREGYSVWSAAYDI